MTCYKIYSIEGKNLLNTLLAIFSYYYRCVASARQFGQIHFLDFKIGINIQFKYLKKESVILLH